MTITKRNGKYYCRFQIDGERHHYLCAGAKDEKQALKIEQGFMYKVQQQQNGVIPREQKSVSFERLCDMYWDYACANNSDIKHVRSKIKFFKSYFGANKPVDKILPTDMEGCKSHLISLGYAPATVNKYRSAAIKLFNVGIDNDILIKNPCRTWKKMVEDNVKLVYYTEAEEKKFFKYCPEWLADLVTLALKTGLRKSNVRLFQKSWIDFDESIIRIPRTQNKGRKYIELPFGGDLKDLFLRHINNSSDTYLFINEQRNTPYCDKRIDEAFAETCKKAGIKNIGFHGLRHTVGTRLGENGVDLAVIQDILAHTSVATTKRYRHTTSEQINKAMQVLYSNK